jgi:hypothetical protein
VINASNPGKSELLVSRQEMASVSKILMELYKKRLNYKKIYNNKKSSDSSDGSDYGLSLNPHEKCRYRCCHGAVMITLSFDESAEITLFPLCLMTVRSDTPIHWRSIRVKYIEYGCPGGCVNHITGRETRPRRGNFQVRATTRDGEAHLCPSKASMKSRNLPR